MLCLFFFCFATLCAFITGHILALPVLYAIFNGLALGILALIDNVLYHFVYGFTQNAGAWNAVKWLSPLYCIFDKLKVSYRWEDQAMVDIRLNGMPVLLAYAVAGLLLAGVALLLYRRHHAENAGEVITVAWLRPVFKYGVAFCGALAFGSLLFEIFSDSLRENVLGLMGFLLLCGFLSYLAAEMLLQKSFRVLRKSWKGCVCFLAVLVVLTAVMELDVTGYENVCPSWARWNGLP